MSEEKSGPRKASDMPLPGGDFLLFIQSLAAQASISLGVAPNPQTGETKVDLPTAQYFIDLLGMLEKKTEGNRTEGEDRFLKEVLIQLRLAYVEVKKKEEGEGASGGGESVDREKNEDSREEKGEGSGS